MANIFFYANQNCMSGKFAAALAAYQKLKPQLRKPQPPYVKLLNA